MKNINKDFLNQHSRPLTRREFVARGLMGATGVAFAPTLLSSLTRSAFADDVGPLNLPSILTFDLVGGAGLIGSFLVGLEGGPEDLLPSYDMHGWNPRLPGAIDKTFGLPMAGNNVSKILVGMKEVMSAEAQAKFRWGSLLHFSRDDTQDNPLSILSTLAMAGWKGTELNKTIGSINSSSGGNSRTLEDLPLYRPVHVQQFSTLDNATGISGKLRTLPASLKSRFSKALGKVSTSQARDILGGSGEDFVQQIAFGHKELEEYTTRSVSFDPRIDPIFEKIYDINKDTVANDPVVTRAAIVRSVLSQMSGPGVISIGGCDYHDGTQASGDATDLEIGRSIGRAIEAAHQMKRKLLIQVYTDGGMYPTKGTRIWTGDQGDRSMGLVGVYDPKGPVAYRSSKSMQIGAYTSGQGVDLTTIIGASPAKGAYAVLANFLNLSGRIDEFTVLGKSVFTKEELESVLIFE